MKWIVPPVITILLTGCGGGGGLPPIVGIQSLPPQIQGSGGGPSREAIALQSQRVQDELNRLRRDPFRIQTQNQTQVWSQPARQTQTVVVTRPSEGAAAIR